MSNMFSLKDILICALTTSIGSFIVGVAVDSIIYDKIIVFSGDNKLMINISDNSTDDVDIFTKNNSIKNSLDCYPQFDKTSLNEVGYVGRSFLCGKYTYAITAFSEEYSDDALGGTFPLTKTLTQIGCKLDSETLICREERNFSAGTYGNLLSYREIVAQVVSPTMELSE